MASQLRMIGWAAAVALMMPVLASGQTVSVRALHAETSAPVVGALVHLLDREGLIVRRGLTDYSGRTAFTDVAPGAYRVRIEMIGMATAETSCFEMAADARVQRDVKLVFRPINVQGFDVEVDKRCRVDPKDGKVTAQLWEEARKALRITELTERDDVYLYRLMLYERDMDRDGAVVRREAQSRRQATLRKPFRSLPAERLMTEGFVETSGEVRSYFAPDAEVLLSEPFLDSHCFRARPGDVDEHDGLVGLAFEPLERRGGKVDISPDMRFPLSGERRGSSPTISRLRRTRGVSTCSAPCRSGRH